MPLTKRQREILNYLTVYTEQNGFAPSFEEIAENFEYNSLATVHEHLTNLERKGYIKRSYNESRAIEILPSEATPRAIELPLLGGVAAGVPIEALEVERDLLAFRRRSSVAAAATMCCASAATRWSTSRFATATSSSSTSASAPTTAKWSSRCVNGTSATVKKYYRERDGRIRLQPANEAMQPIYVHENDVSDPGHRRRA